VPVTVVLSPGFSVVGSAPIVWALVPAAAGSDGRIARPAAAMTAAMWGGT
jgi:hypothetical protein